MVTCLCHPIQSRPRFNLSEVCSSPRSQVVTRFAHFRRFCVCGHLVVEGRTPGSRAGFCCFVMSTLGTLGYYADSHIPHEDDDDDDNHPLAPSFSAAPALHHTRELMLCDYGEQESYPFQARSALFGASWSPVQPPGSASIAYQPYVHHPCPPAEPETACVRPWAPEPLSASLPFAGLPTDTQHDIKLEPLLRRGECTALGGTEVDQHADAIPVVKKKGSEQENPTQPKDDNVSTDTKPDLDPSKCGSSCAGFLHIMSCHFL